MFCLLYCLAIGRRGFTRAAFRRDRRGGGRRGRRLGLRRVGAKREPHVIPPCVGKGGNFARPQRRIDESQLRYRAARVFEHRSEICPIKLNVAQPLVINDQDVSRMTAEALYPREINGRRTRRIAGMFGNNRHFPPSENFGKLACRKATLESIGQLGGGPLQIHKHLRPRERPHGCRGGSAVRCPRVRLAGLAAAIAVYSAAVALRIGTTCPEAGAAAQNFAQASASWRRFWNRSPRR